MHKNEAFSKIRQSYPLFKRYFKNVIVFIKMDRIFSLASLGVNVLFVRKFFSLE